MARFTACLLAITLAACQLGVEAAPLSSRNAKTPGNFIQCNVARIMTVAGLSSTNSAVEKIAAAAGSDTALAAAAASAKTGLTEAQSGIQTIARALISRQPPPATARDQVGKGLNTAQTALAGVNSADPAITSRLNDARSKLKQTIAAGQQVVNGCGSAAVNPNPNDGAATAAEASTTIATETMTATAITGIETSSEAIISTAIDTAPDIATLTTADAAASGTDVATRVVETSVVSLTNTDAAATPTDLTPDTVLTTDSAVLTVTDAITATTCPPAASTVTTVVTITVQPAATGTSVNPAKDKAVKDNAAKNKAVKDKVAKVKIGNKGAKAGVRVDAQAGIDAEAQANAQADAAADVINDPEPKLETGVNSDAALPDGDLTAEADPKVEVNVEATAIPEIGVEAEAGSNAESEIPVDVLLGAGLEAGENTLETKFVREKRQVGNFQCNISRLQAVRGLSSSTRAIGAIAKAAENDDTTTAAAQTAHAALQSSEDGISVIAKALASGKSAPAAGRIQVDDGLKAAQTALNTIASTDPAIVSAITDAQTRIADTLSASASVASNCQ